MKLLTLTNRIYLGFTAALLVVIGTALYFIITSTITEEVGEKLRVDRERVVNALEAGHSVVPLPPIILIDTLPTDAPAEALHEQSAKLLDPIEQDVESFHEVSGSQLIRGTHLRITVRAVVLEPHDYLFSIGLALVLGSLVHLVGLWWLNRRLARTVWAGFHEDLALLQRFDLRKDEPLLMRPSVITEFAELNTVIVRLTERILGDHRALQEFTGNASHEMRTPLATLQARLEEALNRPGLDEGLATSIHDAHAQCLRLARLHQGLLLLSRIENRQFKGTVTIRLKDALDAELARHADRLAAGGIQVEYAIDADPMVQAHPELLDALLANLIGNAIKHYRGPGAIRIALSSDGFEVSNPGTELGVDAEEMFQRFRKADATSPSPGLGLAIARSICDHLGLHITYTERQGQHRVTVVWDAQDPSNFAPLVRPRQTPPTP